MEERTTATSRPHLIDLGAIVLGAVAVLLAYQEMDGVSDALLVASWIAPVVAVPGAYEALDRYGGRVWGVVGRETAPQWAYDATRAVTAAVMGVVGQVAVTIAYGLVLTLFI